MVRRSEDGRPLLAPPTDVSISDRDETDAPSGRTIEVCVRSLSEEVQPLLDRTLRRLRESSDVHDVSVVVWGRSFDPTGPAATTAVGRALADRLETFREWAAANGVSFGPFFEAHTIERVTGDVYTRVELPTVTLAEYRDGELAFVAPCWMGENYHGVLDRAERVADGTVGSTGVADPPDHVEPTDRNGAFIRT